MYASPCLIISHCIRMFARRQVKYNKNGTPFNSVIYTLAIGYTFFLRTLFFALLSLICSMMA